MKIAVGSDHAGFELKESIKIHLISEGHGVTDFGTDSKESTDYPDYACKVAGGVARGDFDRGILVCWTGNGMAIAANKVKGVRAGVCLNEKMAQLTRGHNDANILCLPSLFVEKEDGLKIVRVFLTTEFEGGRHARRVDKILEYERRGE